VAGDALVYVPDGKAIVPRKVQIGMDNNRMVRIVSGIEEGQAVVLDPPLKSSADMASSAGAEPNTTAARESNAFDEQVRGKLDASRQNKPVPAGMTSQGASPTSPGFQGPPGGKTPPGMPNLSPEQQKQMQKTMEVMKNLSEEEKERLKTMSMEERMEFFKEKTGGDQPQ
jgi:hypothetical protein